MALRVIGSVDEEIPERPQVTPSKLRVIGTVGEEPLETSRPSKMQLVGKVDEPVVEPQAEPPKNTKEIPMSIGDMMGIVAGNGVFGTPEMADAVVKEKGQVFVDGMSHGNANLFLYYRTGGKYGLKPSKTQYESLEDGAIHMLGNMAGGDILTIGIGGAIGGGAPGALGLTGGMKVLYETLIEQELVNDYDEFKDVVAQKGASVLSAAREDELNLMGKMTGGFMLPPDQKIADLVTNVMKETAKGEILGYALKPVEAISNPLLRTAAEMGVFGTVGPILEGEAPSPKSYAEAAVQIGAMKAVGGVTSETSRFFGKMRKGAQLGEQPESLKQLQYQMEEVGLTRKQASANAAMVRASANYYGMDVDEFVRSNFAGFTREGNVLSTDYLKQYKGNVVKDFEAMRVGKKKKGTETIDDKAIEKNKREFAAWFLDHPAGQDTMREMELAMEFWKKMVHQKTGENALRLNDKTIFSIDISSSCPFGEGGNSCIMCYVDMPRAWLLQTMKAAGSKYPDSFGGTFMDQAVSPEGIVSVRRSNTGEWEDIGTMTDVKKIIAQIRKQDKSIKGMPRNPNAMFNNAKFDESYIKDMPDLWVNYLNSIGGLRVFSTGDFRSMDIPTLDRIVATSKDRGLKLKFITKQKEAVERYAGEDHVTFNLSSQFNPDLIYTHARPAYEKLTKVLGYKPKDAEKSIKVGQTILKSGFFSQGFTLDQIKKYQDQYGFEKIKGRYVSMNKDEYIRAIATKGYGVVTRYHGFTEPNLLKSCWRASNRFRSYYQNAFDPNSPTGKLAEDYVASIFENVKDPALKEITQADLDHVLGKGKVALSEFQKWVDAKTCCVGGTCGGCLIGCATSQKEAMGLFKKYQDGTPLAGVEFLANGKALIKIFESPANVATVAHELAHVFRRILDIEDLKVAGDWAGAVEGVWSRNAEENFSNGYERFLATGVSPTPKMARIFELFRNWMKEVYGELDNMEGKPLTPEMKEVFDKLTGKPKTRSTIIVQDPGDLEEIKKAGLESQKEWYKKHDWYMGTKIPFSDIQKDYKKTGKPWHRGYFATDNKEVAKKFGDTVTRLEVSPKKLFDARNPEMLEELVNAYFKVYSKGSKDERLFRQNLRDGNPSSYEDPGVQMTLQELGYDSNWQIEDKSNVIRLINSPEGFQEIKDLVGESQKSIPSIPKNGEEIEGLPGYIYVELPRSEMRKMVEGIEDPVSNWGTFNRKEKKIYVSNDLSPKQKFETFQHEKYHAKYYEEKSNFDVATDIMRAILDHKKKKSTAREIEEDGRVLPETVEQFNKIISSKTGKITDNPVFMSYVGGGDIGLTLMQEAYAMEMSNRELRKFDLQMFASDTASPDAKPPVGKYDNTPKMQLGRKILEQVVNTSNVPDLAKQNGYIIGPVYRYIPSKTLEPFFSESKSGIWFADNEKAAMNFGMFKEQGEESGKGVVLKAYLSIKKPEGFPEFYGGFGGVEGSWENELMRKKLKESYKKRPKDTIEAMRKEAEKRGADAFIIGEDPSEVWLDSVNSEERSTGRQFVVFEPRQILWEDNPNVDFGGKAVTMSKIPSETLSMPTMEWSNIDTRPLLEEGPIDWKKFKEKFPFAETPPKISKAEALAKAEEINLRKAIENEANKRGLSYDEINAITSERSLDIAIDKVMKDIQELGTNEVSATTKQHLDAILNVPAHLGRMLGMLNLNKEKRRLARKIATLVKQGNIPEFNKEQIVDIAMKIKQGQATTDEIRAVANNIGNPEVWRYLSSLWINNILSGPGTQIVNIVSNTAMFGVNIPHKALRGAVDGVLSMFVSNRERQFYMDEALPTWAAPWKKGAKGAGKAFKQVMTQGFSEEYASKFEDKRGVYRGVWQNREITPENWKIFTKTFFGKQLGVPEGLKGKKYYPFDKDLLNLFRSEKLGLTEKRFKVSIGTLIETPTMALSGVDVMFKSMIYEVEKATIAMRVVRNAVKRGDVSIENFEKLYEALISNPTEQMREEAFRKSQDSFGLIGEDAAQKFEQLGYAVQAEAVAVAKKLTFTDEPGEITRSINHIIDLLPYGAGRYIVPFTNIATQLLRRGIEYLPGIGAVSMRRAGEKTAEILAKQIEGLIFTTAIMTMHDMGIITGKPPESQAERDALYATGWKPYAVKIGGTYYQWNRIEPFKIAAAMILAVIEQFDKDDDERTFTEKFMGAVKQFGEAYVDSHYLKGLQDLLGRYGAWESWVQRFAASWVPWSGMWRFVNRGLEGFEKGAASVKQSRTFKDAFAQTVPFGYKWARPQLNALGEEQYIEGGAIRQMLPFKAGGEKNHMIYETLLETDYFPGRVPRNITYRGKKYELDEDEVLKYQRIAGSNIYDRLSRVIERPGFSRLTKEQQKKLLNKVTMKAKSRARANFVKDFLYDRAIEELKK